MATVPNLLTAGESASRHQVVKTGTFQDHGRVCRNFRFYWPTAQLAFDRQLDREILLVVDNAGRLLTVDFVTGTTATYPLPVRGMPSAPRTAHSGSDWVSVRPNWSGSTRLGESTYRSPHGPRVPRQSG